MNQGYADLVALCRFLPGPASSQVGYALGLLRGGPVGGLAAWCAFTLPSALLLVLLALGAGAFGEPVGTGLSTASRSLPWRSWPLSSADWQACGCAGVRRPRRLDI